MSSRIRPTAPGPTLVAVLLLSLLAGAGCASEAPDPDPVLATVDGLDLRQDAFLRSYIDYLVTTGQNDTEPLRRRHFEALVDALLLGAEAERRGLAADSAFEASERVARRRLIGAHYYETAVFDTLAPPNEQDVRRAYQLSEEERIIRQLYFTSADSAQAAYERIQRGRSFLDEAFDLYGTRDSTAGLLGRVSYWQLDDAVAEAAFTTPVGEVSAPVRSRVGLHIVYVEDRLRNPLLSESEFARRRKGVESQLSQRRRRIEGDSFIRAFMERRNVAVNRAALVALTQAIDDVEGEPLPDAQQGQGQAFTPIEVGRLAEALRPETPLATFEIDGQTEVFTVADYLAWIDVLPPSEARDRTGASLGRALRNEALARAGEHAGVADDPDVRRELDRTRRLQLADVLRVRLRETAPAAADSARLARVADDLNLAPQRTVVDYWVVRYTTRAEAEAGLQAVTAAPQRAATRPGFERVEGQPLTEAGPLASAVRGAPIGQPVLAAAGEGAWAVLEVVDRRTEVTGDATSALAPFAAEADLVQRLRAERPVVLNEQAVAAAMRPPAVPTRGR